MQHGFSAVSCCLQLYDTSAEVKLNDVIEVVGVLSVDPSLAGFTSSTKYVRLILELTAIHRLRRYAVGFHYSAFSALTLLVECQEGHPARKNLTDKVLAWLSSGAKCK